MVMQKTDNENSPLKTGCNWSSVGCQKEKTGVLKAMPEDSPYMPHFWPEFSCWTTNRSEIVRVSWRIMQLQQRSL